jgi:hypothetical protein
MRRLLGVILISLVALGALVGQSTATNGSPGGCSRALAKKLIHEYPHLDPWAPIYEAPGAVLCGPFLGKGSNALVMSFAAATCGGSSGWAAFRRQGGEWKLAWRHRDGQRNIRAVGSDIEETLNILRPGDPRCLPTGGTKSRTWHWDGRRFVPSRWEYHYVNPAEFLSPDHKVWCALSEVVDTFCVSGGPDPKNEPQGSATFDRNGKVTICSAAHVSPTEGCSQNWNSKAAVLGYGEKSEVGGVRCTSAEDGITCVKVTGPGKGNGFRIDATEVVPLPGSAAANRLRQSGRAEALARAATSQAALWGALDGKVICGFAIHAPGAPDELLCAARSIPAPKHTPADEGDPGFVFLRSAGRPHLARLSQYSWQNEDGWDSRNRTELRAGQVWSSDRIGAKCVILAKAVRCTNGAHHGFKVKTGYYNAF